MLSHNELKKGTLFILNNQPCEVLEHSLVFKGRGSSVMQVKVKNLIAGNTLTKTFHPNEEFEEAEIEKVDLQFIYSRNAKYIFCNPDNQSERTELLEEQIGPSSKFLKQNQMITGLTFDNKIINITLPIKVKLKVIEAPPGIKGNRAESGTKKVTLETGAIISAPLFIKQDDIIEINTEIGQYTRRIE